MPETEPLAAFCQKLCAAIESLPTKTQNELWEAFVSLQPDWQETLGGKVIAKEDLRDIFDAIINGLT